MVNNNFVSPQSNFANFAIDSKKRNLAEAFPSSDKEVKERVMSKIATLALEKQTNENPLKELTTTHLGSFISTNSESKPNQVASSTLLNHLIRSNLVHTLPVIPNPINIPLRQTEISIFSSPYSHCQISDEETINKLNPNVFSEKQKAYSIPANLALTNSFSLTAQQSALRKKLYKEFEILQGYEPKYKGVLRLDSNKNPILSYLKEGALVNISVHDRPLPQTLEENGLKSLVAALPQYSSYNHGDISREEAEAILDKEESGAALFRYSGRAECMVLSYKHQLPQLINDEDGPYSHQLCEYSSMDVLLEENRIDGINITKLILPKNAK